MPEPGATFLAMMLLRILSRREFRGFRFQAAAGLLLVTSALALPTVAQVQAGRNSGQPVRSASGDTAGATKKLTFDAASIRPSTQKGFLNGYEFLSSQSNQAPPQGGLFSWNVRLGWLIPFAYDLRTPQVIRSSVAALPKWAQDEWYEVEARASGNPSRADVRQMVRSLLEERFQFAAHVEKRDGEVYLLKVAKPGLGLKPHPQGTDCTIPSSLMDTNKYPHAYPPYQGVPARCGVFNRQLSRAGERRFEMLDVTMQQIADFMSPWLPLSVSDGTGLQGHYDAVVDFGRNAIPQNVETSDELGLPMLPAALEKQLGLKLVKQKTPVDVFVIDHIGPLQEN